MVETTEQREAVMKFFSALYGWTWEVGDENMGYYSIAQCDGAPVMGLGQGPGSAGVMTPYFLTDDIEASVATAAQLGGNAFMGPMEVPGAGNMALASDPTGRRPRTLGGAASSRASVSPTNRTRPAGSITRRTTRTAAATYYDGADRAQHHRTVPGMKVLTAGEQWFASVSENQIPERPGAQWNSIYIVETPDAARDKVSDLGGTILMEEMPVPG